MSNHITHPPRQSLSRYEPMLLLISTAPLEGVITTVKIRTDLLQNIAVKVAPSEIPGICPGTRSGNEQRCRRTAGWWPGSPQRILDLRIPQSECSRGDS